MTSFIGPTNMFALRADTASQELILGPFVDETDGKTAETGLTIANTDIKLWKHGTTTEANKNSGGGTHIAGGRYSIVMDATDTDTDGNMQISVHVAGALPVWVHCFVYPTAVYDLTIGVTTLGTQQTGDTYARLGAPAGASVSADIAAIEAQTDDIGVAGAGLTAVPWNATWDAEVQSEVQDALDAAVSEPGQGAPAVNASLASKISYLYKAWRNKKEQTATEQKLYNDDGTTVGQKATVSDDATTATVGEMGTGA